MTDLHNDGSGSVESGVFFGFFVNWHLVFFELIQFLSNLRFIHRCQLSPRFIRSSVIMINVVNIHVLIKNYPLLYQLLNTRPDTQLPTQLPFYTLPFSFNLPVALPIPKNISILQIVLTRPLTQSSSQNTRNFLSPPLRFFPRQMRFDVLVLRIGYTETGVRVTFEFGLFVFGLGIFGFRVFRFRVFGFRGIFIFRVFVLLRVFGVILRIVVVLEKNW